MLRTLLPTVACVLLVGCGAAHARAHDDHLTVDGRRVLVRVPASAHPPLLLILHGYSGDALEEEQRLGLRAPAARNGMLEVLPNGLRDSYGNRFWNATSACCAAAGPKVDDSRFLGRLIAEVRRRYHADPQRIFVAGLS